MVGLVDKAKAYFAAQRFRRSHLGQALELHTRQYFYSGQVLSWFNQEAKDRLIGDFYAKIAGLAVSPTGTMDLRKMLAEYTLAFAPLQILAMTEEEKADQPYAANPYISGTIYRHAVEAAAHVNEAAEFVWKHDGATADEIISYANSRGALMLYYANGLNIVRVDSGDCDQVKDWFLPFVEAMLIVEEDHIRRKLGLPRLVPEPLHSLPYTLLLNLVVDGEPNPFFEWRRKFPDLYLGGEGPLPE